MAKKSIAVTMSLNIKSVYMEHQRLILKTYHRSQYGYTGFVKADWLMDY